MKVNKHRARKNLYERGLRIPANNKQGYKIDRTQPADEEDKVIIQAGQEYYSWHRKGNKLHTYSLTPYVYQKPYNEWDDKFNEFSNRIEECVDVEGLEEDSEDLQSEIEEFQSELQDRLDNMPQQLQESSVLNERIEQLQELLDRFN